MPSDYSFTVEVTVENYRSPEDDYELRDVEATLILDDAPALQLADGERATKSASGVIENGGSHTFSWRLVSSSEKRENRVGVRVTGTVYYPHDLSTRNADDEERMTRQRSVEIAVGEELVERRAALTAHPVGLMGFALGVTLFSVLVSRPLLHSVGHLVHRTARSRSGSRSGSQSRSRRVTQLLGGARYRSTLAFIMLGLVVVVAVWSAVQLNGVSATGDMATAPFGGSGVLTGVIAVVGFLFAGCFGLISELIHRRRNRTASEPSSTGHPPKTATVALIAATIAVVASIQYLFLVGPGYSLRASGWLLGRFTGFLLLALLALSIVTGGCGRRMKRFAARFFPTAAARVRVHCFLSYLMVALAIYHAIVLLAGVWAGTTRGLASGLTATVAIFFLGLTGSFHTQLLDRLGRDRWRALHLFLTVLVIAVVIEHAVLNGTDLAFLRGG